MLAHEEIGLTPNQTVGGGADRIHWVAAPARGPPAFDLALSQVLDGHPRTTLDEEGFNCLGATRVLVIGEDGRAWTLSEDGRAWTLSWLMRGRRVVGWCRACKQLFDADPSRLHGV